MLWKLVFGIKKNAFRKLIFVSENMDIINF